MNEDLSDLVERHPNEFTKLDEELYQKLVKAKADYDAVCDEIHRMVEKRKHESR
jgi:predicted CopG family antitoxin